jgi:hypothetical protein
VCSKSFAYGVAILELIIFATTIVRLGPAGTKVTVNCFVVGKPVFGDSVWYHIVKPASGFVAGFYLDTGRDPAPGIRHC